MNLGHFLLLFVFVGRGREVSKREGKGPGEKPIAPSGGWDHFPVVPVPLVTDPVPSMVPGTQLL